MTAAGEQRHGISLSSLDDQLFAGADATKRDLLDHLESRANENHVRVFTVAYGSSADLATLTSIATATRAKAYDARDATNIGRVFTAILSNF